MLKKHWLDLVAAHSDAWLISVSLNARHAFKIFDRMRLFNMMNDLPTVFEVVTGSAKKRQQTEKSLASRTFNPHSSIGYSSQLLHISPSLIQAPIGYRLWRHIQEEAVKGKFAGRENNETLENGKDLPLLSVQKTTKMIKTTMMKVMEVKKIQCNLVY
ncbi:PHD finger protein ALFIN-LIKE 6-like [Impatiens glandulifera]|uniref:PHD finger protein ALFIN-LIKE 6-like n=1 Tax=Impatiens glandulifera TaxID=253017 RepID=UPI001FB10727|nr:PHD finger protein ALFIN-LIKE 6-like [Impatiens glandulifera]